MISRIDPKTISKVVSLRDKAVNLEKSNIDEYEKTADIKHLVFDGEPTYFLVKNITAREQATISEKYVQFDGGTSIIKNQNSMMVDVFDATCKEIEENGEKIKVDSSCFSLETVLEIASYVILRSKFFEVEKK